MTGHDYNDDDIQSLLGKREMREVAPPEELKSAIMKEVVGAERRFPVWRRWQRARRGAALARQLAARKESPDGRRLQWEANHASLAWGGRGAVLLGISALAVVVIATFAITGFPPGSRGTEGTIGAPKSDGLQQFLESDTWDRLMKNKPMQSELRVIFSDQRLMSALADPELSRRLATRDVASALATPDLVAVLSSADFEAALANPQIHTALGDARVQAALRNPSVRSAIAHGATDSVRTDPDLAAARRAPGFQAVLDSPAMTKALATPAFATVLAHPTFEAALGNAEFVAAVENPAFEAALARASFRNALGNADFEAALANGAFRAALTDTMLQSRLRAALASTANQR
jgi:hypothetical protein